jgi:hypothetical protein
MKDVYMKRKIRSFGVQLKGTHKTKRATENRYKNEVTVSKNGETE